MARPYTGLAVDLSVAVVAFVVSVGVLSSGGFGTPDPGMRGLDQVAVVVGALATLPLAARRFAPLTVYLLTALATGLLLYLRYPFELPLGAAIAAYEVARAYGDAGRTRRLVAMTAVAAFVPFLTFVYTLAGVHLEAIVSGLLLWVAIFVGLWIAGDRARLRRERLAGLEEQARRSLRDAERERRLAVAEERTRIARELHDSAGHAINVILVQAGAARLLQERDPAGSRQAIAAIEDVARATITEIDRLVHALREDDPAVPPPPADPGALAELLSEQRSDGLVLTSEVRGEPRPLPRGVAWAAYRILQEALTNAARHGTGTAHVTVDHKPDAVELAVRNPVPESSRTFATVPAGSSDLPAGDAPGTSGASHGIIGMRERATLLGGSFEARADHGTFWLRARLPFDGSGR
ncbi:Signal transduction histidine kinase [Actinopolymorpha singaporensis]|uniref:histidine kinase n=2 Tax=Actinopolymorpha singaporensis TaxID=117157 RepID=A0A1H1MC39_9ACTN|nr:Signal transduction histidine kinase [Actinopolymorpha singaporensis]